MKILVFYARSNKTLTGGPRTILSLFDEICSESIKLTFISPSSSILTEALRQKGFSVILQPLSKRLAMTGGKAFDFSIFGKTRMLLDAISYNLNIRKIIIFEGFDCIWARNVKSVTLVAFASFLTRKPLIWDIALERRVNLTLWPIYFLGLLLSSAVVTEGSEQPEEIFGSFLHRIFRKKFNSILPGISFQRESKINSYISATKKEKNNQAFNLLNIATVNERKNQNFILEILRELSNLGIPVRLDIVGPIEDREYYRDCQNFIEHNDLKEKVVFHGWQESIETFLGQSQLLVVASKNEGIPHAIYEAMHAGLAVVATPVGGIPDVIKHEKTGWIIHSDSSQEAAQQIKEYLLDLSSREKIVEEARDYAKKMLVIRRWAKDYSSLLLSLA